MLSEALQRNAKHKARLSNISRYLAGLVRKSDQRFFSAIADQNDICEMGKVLFSRDSCESRVTPK